MYPLIENKFGYIPNITYICSMDENNNKSSWFVFITEFFYQLITGFFKGL